MPHYTYKAKKGPSELVQGSIVAENSDQATQRILQLGYTPVEILTFEQDPSVKKEYALPQFNWWHRIPSAQINLFTYQLADLLSARVDLLRALQLIGQQTKHLPFQKIILNLYDFVKEGSLLSEALSHYPDIFPSFYIEMVKSGELAGNLEVILRRLAQFAEKDQEIRKQIRLSLAYPAFVLGIGLLTVFVLLTWVVPRLSVIYEDFQQDLPWPTVFLNHLSQFFVQFWWLILVIGVGASWYIRRFLQSPAGRTAIDAFKLKTPIFGSFLLNSEVSRFGRSLGTLVQNGITIVSALQAVISIIDNTLLKQDLKQTISEISNGESLSLALKRTRHFPGIAVNMITVGEETGQLDHALFQLAESYERQAEDTRKIVMSLFGPLVLVLIVIMVGFVVIALLLPIFQINLIIP